MPEPRFIPPPRTAISAGRILIAALVVLLATAYDKRLWLASEEPRWMSLHVLTLLAAGSFLLAHARSGLQVRCSQPASVWFALLFALSALLSMHGSFDPFSGWWSLKGVLACVGLFLLVVALRDEHWYWRLAWLLTLTVGFNGLLGILQFHGVDDRSVAGVWAAWARPGPIIDYFGQTAIPGATFVNKNVAASFLVLTLPVASAVFLGSRSRGAQVVAALCVALGTILWAYTRTRSAWLGVAVAAVGAALLLARSAPAWALVRVAFTPSHRILASIATALVIVAVSMPSRLPTDVLSRGVGEQMGTIFDAQQESYVVRWGNNLNSLKMAINHPVNGVGLGAFRAAYPLYHNAWTEVPTGAYGVAVRWNHLHNDWLQTFVELGLPGGIALIGFFAAVSLASWRLAATAGSQRAGLLGLSVLVGIAGLSVDSLANFPLQLPTAGLVWCLAGCATGLYLLAAESHGVPPADHRVIARQVIWGAGLALLVFLAVVARDDLQRWESGRHLKVALILNRTNSDFERAIAEADLAYAIDPRNPKVQETRALAYARDTRGAVAPPDRIIQVIEESLTYDPYSSFLLITLGKLVVYQAFLAPGRVDGEPVSKWAAKLTTTRDRLRRVESRRAEVPAFGGYIALLQSRPKEAVAMFEDALKIAPEDRFVRYGADLAARKAMDAR